MNLVKWHGLDIDPMKIHESLETKPEIGQIDTAFNESTMESGITVLYPRIEAIHEGRTRNFNRYLKEKLKGDHELKSGIYSWTAPYPKPVILNHDVNTEATGRVYSASFSDITNAGRPGIIITPRITQEKAIKDILEGRLLTVSIGATTNAAICSICSTDIINEGFCGHMRGEEYDGVTAEWVAGDLWFDEVSWVNVPADPDAMIISTGAVQNTAGVGESIKVVVDSTEITDNSIENPSVENQTTELLDKIDDESSTALTEESQVVKSVNESTEKEENGVPNEEQTIVTETTETTDVVEETTETKTTEVEEQVDENTSEVTETKDDEVQEDVEEIKLELEEAKRSVAELTAANEALAKELSETVAGFLVDLRLAIGKESNREEAVAKFASRSVESIRDSIADLLSENPSIQTKRTVEQVEKPAGEPVVVSESKTMTTDSRKVISNEDALLSLLNGKR